MGFDTIERIVNDLEQANVDSIWAKELRERLKNGKLYLQVKYPVHCAVESHQQDTKAESESLHDNIRRDWANKFANLNGIDREIEEEKFLLLVQNAIGLTHPMLYGECDICKYVVDGKLGKFTIALLRKMLMAFEVHCDVTDRKPKLLLRRISKRMCCNLIVRTKTTLLVVTLVNFPRGPSFEK